MGRFVSDTLKSLGLESVAKVENTRIRKLDPVHSAAAATLKTFTIELPKDRLIHSVLISIGESTTATGDTEQGTLADDITDIKLDSSHGVLKELTGGMAKQIGIVNMEVQDTGYYKLYFVDPALKTLPLPSWVFSSLTLKIIDNAPAASNYHHIRVSVEESEVPPGLDVSKWRILTERYSSREAWGTATGAKRYEHSRAYKVLGYLYAMDDNGTLSATIFDKLTVTAIGPGGEFRMADEQWIPHLVQLNKQRYVSAFAAGYAYLEFPDGFETKGYNTLRSTVTIPTAGTDAGLRVLERYLS